MIVSNALHKLQRDRGQPVNAITAGGIGLMGSHEESYSASNATRLADVSRCINILSSDIAKLPWYMMNDQTKERVYAGHLLYLLRTRPNEAMTPFVFKQLLETSVLCAGNAYVLILRNPMTTEPEELLPVPQHLVTPHREPNGFIWYQMQHPLTGQPIRVPGDDVIHLKGWSEDGLKGVSVLQHARDAITSGIAAAEYQKAFYQNGGHPSGLLETDTDLSGTVETVIDGTKTQISKREAVRREWDRFHSGPKNSFKTAVLDSGLKYVPLTISQADAQFVETRKLDRVDISNFFGIPLYKLNDGKQAYSSNEQNAVEYVGTTLQPIVTQWEEEFSYKLLLPKQMAEGWRLRLNMMAALRGDTASRGDWYKAMREIGVFSVDDIRALEDLESVPGGDTRYSSLNYIPLEDFKRLSEARNGGTNGKT